MQLTPGWVGRIQFAHVGPDGTRGWVDLRIDITLRNLARLQAAAPANAFVEVRPESAARSRRPGLLPRWQILLVSSET